MPGEDGRDRATSAYGGNGHAALRRQRPEDETLSAAHALSDRDQSTSDRDQTGADLDQTSSDVDQSAAERDQDASDRDQNAADVDQAASDRALDGRPDDATYRSSRRTRIATTIQRDMATQSR